jgi:hypothetical protein
MKSAAFSVGSPSPCVATCDNQPRSYLDAQTYHEDQHLVLWNLVEGIKVIVVRIRHETGFPKPAFALFRQSKSQVLGSARLRPVNASYVLSLWITNRPVSLI